MGYYGGSIYSIYSSCSVQFFYKRNRNFTMTAKSTREEIKQRKGAPCNIYKELVCEAPEEANRHLVMAPRNVKQVQNAQAMERQKFRLGRDAFYNLHFGAVESNFVKHIQTYPDFICMMYLEPLASKIMGLIDRPDLGSLGFQYDTTFKLGDIYVSVLIVRYLEFDQEPVKPFVLMMHERKTMDVHHAFFRKIAEWFPSLV